MPTVNVYPNAPEPSHDISLNDGVETIGLIYSGGPSLLQEIPISEPSSPFSINQKAWYGGTGRLRYQDDPNGHFDSQSLWNMTDGKMFPTPQWKFAQGIRNCDSSLPGSLSWQPVFGSQRYISVSYASSASYNAAKGLLWLRRIGNPGTLTFEHRLDNAGSPGTVNHTVTKAYTDLGSSLDPCPPSQLLVFNWGVQQVETATVVGTITKSGNATMVLTSLLVVGSPKTISVAVLLNDTDAMVADKMRDALDADAAITAYYVIGGTGADIVLTKKLPAPNDTSLNLAYTNGTCTGLTPDSNSTDTTAGVATAQVNGTTYHLVIYGASTDNEGNHWEVGVGSGTSSKYRATDVAAWTTATFSMYYRVTDGDLKRQWYPFYLYGAQYIVSNNDDAGASQIFINGDRFRPTSFTSLVLTDTSSGVSALWTTNRFAGARMKIISGKGDGQNRAIASNGTTSITVDSVLDITPDKTTSEVIIYNTDWWTEVTGHGLGRVVNKPALGGLYAYFPQGESVNMRRMGVDHTQAVQHNFAADGTNKADFVYTYQSLSGNQIWKIRQASCAAAAAGVQATWTNLIFGAEKPIGTIDTRITNIFAATDLYVFKEDGLFKFESGIPKKVNTGLDNMIDPSNGLAACAAPGAIWIGWNHSIAKMIGSDVSDQMNYRAGFSGIPTDRAGVISSALSVLGWVFFSIDGGDNNYSSIIAWNGFGWMELFRSWTTGVRIRNLFWQSGLNSRPQLWFDVGGDLAYMDFPQRVANPLLDTGLSYQHEGVLITSTFDANEANLYKLFHSFKIVSDNLGAFGKVYVDFQTNEEIGTGAWHNAGQMMNLTYKEFIIDLGEKYSIRFRLRLQTTVATSPPIVLSYGCDGTVASPLKYQWVGSFKVGMNYSTKNSQDDHEPDDIVNFLRSCFEKSKKVRLRSLKSTMDDKVVTLSAPVIITDSLTDEGWSGKIQIAIRQT